MADLTYDAIKPLIHNEEQKGGAVEVVFRCPETGVEATGSAAIKAGKGMKSTAVRSAKKSLWYSLRRAVSSSLYSMLGSGTAGRVARDVARQGMSNAEQGAKFSGDDVKAAVVAAFEKVRTRFRWDGANDRWIGAPSADTPFGKQLAAAPVAESYDQGIMSRLLVEIVCADGVVRDEEREFLADFIDPEVGTVEDLAKRDPLSPAELEAVDDAARDTLVMLAWAAALSDEDLAEEEAGRLTEVATGLGVADDRVVELRSFAQQFLLEQALATAYPGGTRDDGAHTEAMAAAAKLGITPEDAERIDVAYRKRSGIV